jgi:hypothetical protein
MTMKIHSTTEVTEEQRTAFLTAEDTEDAEDNLSGHLQSQRAVILNERPREHEHPEPFTKNPNRLRVHLER